MSAKEILDEYGEEPGWDNEKKFNVCQNYIDYLIGLTPKFRSDFELFVRQMACDEDETKEENDDKLYDQMYDEDHANDDMGHFN